jgi:putative transposase
VREARPSARWATLAICRGCAVAPTTGERFFLKLPYLNAEMFQLFLDAFAQAYPDSLNILLLDNSGAHTPHRLHWPPNVHAV